MGAAWKPFVLILVLVAAAGAFALKNTAPQAGAAYAVPPAPVGEVPEDPVPPSYASSQPRLPRLVAIGAGKCIPCRAMAPIRAELRREYAGALVVDFYDVWKDPPAGDHFGVWVIPTLIYYDGAGRELGRFQGYIPKAQILDALDRYGIDLPPVRS